MNKLVSKNPVLRFKEGKKIKKFKNPAGSLLLSPEMEARRLAFQTRLFKATNSNYNLPYTSGVFVSRMKDFGGNLAGTIAYLSEKKRPTVTPKAGKAVKDWDTKFLNNFTNTLTQAQKAYLDSKGVDYSKAANVLEFLMKLLRTDLGGYKNDGKWGTNSINAWKEFAANNIPDYISLPTSEQLIQLVPQNVSVVESVPQAGTNTILNLLTEMQKVMPATGTYTMKPILPKLNRSDTRWVINDVLGKSAYDFTGALRRALRLYLNGEQYDANDLAVFGNLDIFNAYKPGFYKQGGNMLPSRNIVERFKTAWNLAK